MSLNELVVWFIILAPFFCLLLYVFVALVTYRAVVTWREQEALREARNPAGRARRRTVRLSAAGGPEDQQAGPNATRTRRGPPVRGIPRSLADAMVQTSFMLLSRSSARSTDEAGPSARRTPHSNLVAPSIRRQATPGPSAPRLDAPLPSASRADAPSSTTLRLDMPGPSASRSRAVGPDSLAGPVAISTTPCKGKGRDVLAISSPIKWHVRKFTPRGKATQEPNENPVEPSPVITSFYQPVEPGDGPIEAPPDLTQDPDLSLGDLFYHAQRDGTYQLWLWCIGRNGLPWWKPVYVGYQREDGKWLLLTPHLKLPGWVTWDRFSRVVDTNAMFSG